MTLADRLRAIVGVMPEDGAVTLPVRELRTWLQQEPISGDLSLAQLQERHHPEMSVSRLREWCQEGRYPNAYRLRGKGPWRIPVRDVEAAKQADRAKTFAEPETNGTDMLNPRRGKPDTGAWRNF